MKRKDIGIVLAALCLSAALCAVPAGVFAVTDSALFSGAFTQNTRRGSLDVTGDDVYLARVLRFGNRRGNGGNDNQQRTDTADDGGNADQWKQSRCAASVNGILNRFI